MSVGKITFKLDPANHEQFRPSVNPDVDDRWQTLTYTAETWLGFPIYPTPIHDYGWSFKGWAFEGSDVPVNNTEIILSENEELIFHPVWEEVYPIHFNPSVNMLDQPKVLTPSDLGKVSWPITLTLPECEYEAPPGKEFVGWCKKRELDGEEDLLFPGETITFYEHDIDFNDDEFNPKIRLYAIWEDSEKIITVTYHGNNGISDETYVHKTIIGLHRLRDPESFDFTPPSRAGSSIRWKKICWSLVQDDSNYLAYINSTIEFDNNADVFLIWYNPDTDAKINIDRNDGQGTMKPYIISDIVGRTKTVSFNFFCKIKPPSDAYEFEKWSLSPDGVGPSEYTFEGVPEEITVFAVWAQVKGRIQVTLNPMDIPYATEIKNGYPGATLYNLPTSSPWELPTMGTFIGWSYTPGGEVISEGSIVLPAERNLILYVVWEAPPYNILILKSDLDDEIPLLTLQTLKRTIMLPDVIISNPPSGKYQAGWYNRFNTLVGAEYTFENEYNSIDVLHAAWSNDPHIKLKVNPNSSTDPLYNDPAIFFLQKGEFYNNFVYNEIRDKNLLRPYKPLTSIASYLIDEDGEQLSDPFSLMEDTVCTIGYSEKITLNLSYDLIIDETPEGEDIPFDKINYMDKVQVYRIFNLIEEDYPDFEFISLSFFDEETGAETIYPADEFILFTEDFNNKKFVIKGTFKDIPDPDHWIIRFLSPKYRFWDADLGDYTYSGIRTFNYGELFKVDQARWPNSFQGVPSDLTFLGWQQENGRLWLPNIRHPAGADGDHIVKVTPLFIKDDNPEDYVTFTILSPDGDSTKNTDIIVHKNIHYDLGGLPDNLSEYYNNFSGYINPETSEVIRFFTFTEDIAMMPKVKRFASPDFTVTGIDYPLNLNKPSIDFRYPRTESGGFRNFAVQQNETFKDEFNSFISINWGLNPYDESTIIDGVSYKPIGYVSKPKVAGPSIFVYDNNDFMYPDAKASEQKLLMMPESGNPQECIREGTFIYKLNGSTVGQFTHNIPSNRYCELNPELYMCPFEIRGGILLLRTTNAETFAQEYFITGIKDSKINIPGLNTEKAAMVHLVPNQTIYVIDLKAVPRKKFTFVTNSPVTLGYVESDDIHVTFNKEDLSEIEDLTIYHIIMNYLKYKPIYEDRQFVFTNALLTDLDLAPIDGPFSTTAPLLNIYHLLNDDILNDDQKYYICINYQSEVDNSAYTYESRKVSFIPKFVCEEDKYGIPTEEFEALAFDIEVFHSQLYYIYYELYRPAAPFKKFLDTYNLVLCRYDDHTMGYQNDMFVGEGYVNCYFAKRPAPGETQVLYGVGSVIDYANINLPEVFPEDMTFIDLFDLFNLYKGTSYPVIDPWDHSEIAGVDYDHRDGHSRCHLYLKYLDVMGDSPEMKAYDEARGFRVLRIHRYPDYYFEESVKYIPPDGYSYLPTTELRCYLNTWEEDIFEITPDNRWVLPEEWSPTITRPVGSRFTDYWREELNRSYQYVIVD